MAFEDDELFVGMIAYFRVRDLMRHPRVTVRGNTTFDPKPRPFICYAEADGLWYWTHLTGTPKYWRRTIDRKWLRLPPFQRGRLSVFPGDLIVGDGASGFYGPGDAFAKCSQHCDHYDGMMRPVLLAEGITQLHAIILERRGPLPAMRLDVRRAA